MVQRVLRSPLEVLIMMGALLALLLMQHSPAVWQGEMVLSLIASITFLHLEGK